MLCYLVHVCGLVCVCVCVCVPSREIEVLAGDNQECNGHVEKLKTQQLVLHSKCVRTDLYSHIMYCSRPMFVFVGYVTYIR